MGFAVNATDLLEVSELRDFHAVQPNFPAQAPCAQGWIFPIIFDEADVVFLEVKAERFERAQIQLQDVAGRGLQHHLVLVVVLQAVGVLTITTIFGAAARLHISSLPGLWA